MDGGPPSIGSFGSSGGGQPLHSQSLLSEHAESRVWLFLVFLSFSRRTWPESIRAVNYGLEYFRWGGVAATSRAQALILLCPSPRCTTALFRIAKNCSDAAARAAVCVYTNRWIACVTTAFSERAQKNDPAWANICNSRGSGIEGPRAKTPRRARNSRTYGHKCVRYFAEKKNKNKKRKWLFISRRTCCVCFMPKSLTENTYFHQSWQSFDNEPIEITDILFAIQNYNIDWRDYFVESSTVHRRYLYFFSPYNVHTEFSMDVLQDAYTRFVTFSLCASSINH